jgi:four helix bundle protein
MDHEELLKCTAQFAKDIARFAKPLLRSVETFDSARQLRRAATGVASNYRAAGCARSNAEFAARIAIVWEEADESAFWLQHLQATEVTVDRALLLEAIELANIFRASTETSRGRSRPRRLREE